MQHATPQQLVDTGLVTRLEFQDFQVVTVVRNPYGRLVSDFFFLRNHLGFGATFESMIAKTGVWERILLDPSMPSYRGDHLRRQIDYLDLDGRSCIDHLGRFEDLSDTFRLLRDEYDLTLQSTIHAKRQRIHHRHYSHFYSDSEIVLVEALVRPDLEALCYSFEDRRTTLSRSTRVPIRVFDRVGKLAKKRARTMRRRIMQ